MLETLRDLIAHKGHADSAVLATVRSSAGAAADSEVIDLLHHILVANRFWLLCVLGRPFVLDEESRRSASVEEIVRRYRLVHDAELEWLSAATETDLARMLEHPLPSRAEGARCPRRGCNCVCTLTAIEPSAPSCCAGAAASRRHSTSFPGYHADPQQTGLATRKRNRTTPSFCGSRGGSMRESAGEAFRGDRRSW